MKCGYEANKDLDLNWAVNTVNMTTISPALYSCLESALQNILSWQ